MNIKEEIQKKVKERVDKHQREYILREQLKLIREELGEDSTVSDAEEFENALKNLNAPKEVKEKAPERDQPLQEFLKFPGGERRDPDLHRDAAGDAVG